MKTLLTLVKEYLWWLPVISAVMLILALPPISQSWLALMALTPMFAFSYLVPTAKESSLGWFLFASIYVIYIVYTTLSGFHWIDAASLFILTVKAFGCGIALLTASIFALIGYFSKKIGLYVFKNCPVHYRFYVMFGLGLSVAFIFDYIFYNIFSGFNYGALFFAGQNIPYLVQFIKLGHPVAISLAVVLVNILIFASFLIYYKKISNFSYIGVVFVVVLYLSIPSLLKPPPLLTSENNERVNFAIIQDNDRTEAAFGSVKNGEFVFSELESHLASISQNPVDYIIYPFAPWSGVIGKYSDNLNFDRQVIVIDDATFENWLKKYVPKNVIFVTWFTRYEDGHYYNQIVFYKNGSIIGTYNKRHLFPFFDYTPGWALSRGIVSLPYDGTAGSLDQSPININDLSIGTLICSEVGDDTVAKLSAVDSNLLLSIGSESMFTNQIPGEYNALRTQLNAELYNLPVIRANRFGPSVVYDGNGKLLGSLPFNQTGILYVSVPYIAK